MKSSHLKKPLIKSKYMANILLNAAFGDSMSIKEIGEQAKKC